MGRRRSSFVVIIAVAAAGVVAALVALLSAAPFETTLEFRIRDRVSTGAVWNATVTLQDRFLRTYYAGDGDPLVFARLDPGEATLEVWRPTTSPGKCRSRCGAAGTESTSQST